MQTIINLYPKTFTPLFELGRESMTIKSEKIPNYRSLGLNSRDCEILEQLALTKSIDEITYDENFDNFYFAPLHAMIALGQLQYEEIAETFLQNIPNYSDDDFYSTALAHYFKEIGVKSFPLLARYFHDESYDSLDRMSILVAFAALTKAYSEAIEPCEAILLHYLHHDTANDDGLNGYVLSELKRLTGTKHIELIRKTFATKNVDVFFNGDLEDFEIDLGLRTKRETPRPKNEFQMMAEMMRSHLDDTESIPFIANEKIGRNDLCPCGSGKKYKKCCLKT